MEIYNMSGKNGIWEDGCEERVAGNGEWVKESPGFISRKEKSLGFLLVHS